MNTVLKFGLAAILAAFAVPSNAMPEKVTPVAGEAMASVVAIARAGNISGAFAIVDTSGDILEAVVGLADRDRGTPHREGQSWIWASITKQVTAILIMQEVERGRLALDTPVGTYLDTYAGRPITVRQLLQHQSGLPNPSDTPRDAEDMQSYYRETGSVISDTERARGFCAGAPKRVSGGEFEYNNCDYQVLGALLEVVTGLRYDQLIDQRISRPLELESLRMAADGERGGGADVVGYTDGKAYPAINVATLGAAGALVGNVRDLARLDRALMTDELLSPEARATLWSGVPALGYQALGVWSYSAPLKGCSSPIDLVERRGDFAGTQVRNIIAPDLGRTVIIFVNEETVDFGEVWQGAGLSYDLLAAALCSSES
jgi:CubicO group peptidase (beta-lactamase class C family)